MVNTNNKDTIGERIAKLRNKAGFSQRDLARETGISHRMIAYYEKQSKYPPTHTLPVLAKTLGISTDQLLGLEKIKEDGKKKDTRLWRRFSQIEKVPAKDKRQILQILDTFIENIQLKQEAKSK